MIFSIDAAPVSEPAVRAAVEQALVAVAGVDGVTSVASPYPQQEGQPATRISTDGAVAYAQVYFDVAAAGVDEATAQAVLDAARPARDAGLQVLPGGQLAVAAAGEPGHTSELVGLAVAAVVLLVALGAAAAMALPLLSALVGLVAGLAAVGLLSQLGAIPGTATTVATMISLGVGIDYALFLVVRYRALRYDGLDHERALGMTVATAGASVLFAGLTVAVGLGGLLLAGLPLRNRAQDGTRRAVASGLGLSGRVVTAAALIMFSVFASFTGQDDPVIKMFGVGLALAVLLDALVVRGLLVPGLMILLGRSNWWFPTWLDRLLPRLDLEGLVAEEEPPSVDRPVRAVEGASRRLEAQP